MNNKNTGLIATIASVILCGCPGLFMCFYGVLTTFISFVPGADINMFGNTDPSSATTAGVASICVSIILIAIPVAVWFFMGRKKPEASTNEPLPPAS